MDFHAANLREALQQRFRRRAEKRRGIFVILKMFPVVGGEDGDFHSAIF